MTDLLSDSSEGLRLPCKAHDRYEEHPILSNVPGQRFEFCPGGYKPTTEEVWYCKTHRASESAEEGICEVAGLLWNLTSNSSSVACKFDKRLLVSVEGNE